MTRILVCDIDGVIADNLEREMRGRQFADSRFVPEVGIIPSIVYADAWKKIFFSERAFYNPELVALDTLIEGVPEALDKLYGEYGVIFLTSRPESMRGATEAWLEEHDISVEHPQFGDFLVMKPPSAQFVKTTLWKVMTVQMLHRLFDADELLVVDDEPANQKAVLDAYPDGGDFGMVRVYASLAEAVAAL